MKNDFIKAFCYCYGVSKKNALSVYKSASIKYIKAVIDSYNNDVKKAFYND